MTLHLSTTHREAVLHGIKVIVHGRAGVGKTPLCLTAPKPFVISAESGLLSTMSMPDTPVAVIRKWEDLEDAYKFLAYSEHARDFQTGCLDSLTEIAEQCLATQKALSKDPRRAYGEMADKMIQWVKWFRDLPGRNIVFTCKQEWQKDEVTGVSRYGPMMPGQKVGPQLPYLFDEVFSMEVGRDPATGQEFRVLRTKLDIQYEARDRSGKLDQWEAPNLTAIFNKIKSGAPSIPGVTAPPATGGGIITSGA